MYSFRMLENETIVKKALANLTVEKTVLNGAMYLTSERLVFVGYLLEEPNYKYTIEMSLYHIAELRRERNCFFISNILVIRSIQDEEWRLAITKRDSWYEAIQQAVTATDSSQV